jgi:UDP-3-O-[3-hydroxymyristoyl] N-acetylglucosamine deacetylase
MTNTLRAAFELSGVGLHSGTTSTVKVLPAKSGAGRYFIRVDLEDIPVIPAKIDYVSQTNLSTELAVGDAKVRTVEHLLAALMASGIDDARIEIDGAEVPLLDGSARLWTEEIASVGIMNTAPDIIRNFLSEPIWIYDNDAFVAAIPAPEIRFTYGIDFAYPVIGNQWHSWQFDREAARCDRTSFATEIAPARTFGFAEQIEQLQQAGLIKGGSLDNALVCSQAGWLNPPLRFTNEPARHKLLDLVGDISLLGYLPKAHFIAYKASHQLHIELVKRAMDRSNNLILNI